MSEQIPSWWVATSLLAISSKLVDGSHNPPAKQGAGLPMLSAVNINDNKIIFSDYRLISEDAFCLEDRRTKITPGDVLLTIVGAIGRTAVVPESTLKFTLQRSVAVIAPILVSPKFLMYQIEAPRVAQYFKDNARGTAQKGIYLKSLGITEIWLPPLPEQHRIVAKIEELFSELDKGVDSLKTAREQLKVYRQALLKHAFEGKLTAQWRAENGDKLETATALQQRIQTERQERHRQQLADWEAKGKQGSKPKTPKPLPPLTTEDLAELPFGWIVLSVEQFCEIEDGDRGEHYPTKGDFSDSGHCLFLNAKNVTKRGFVFKEKSFISQEKHLVLRKGTLKRGDMVFTSRGTLGNIALYDTSISFECIRLNSGMFIIRGYDAALTPDFLYFHLNAPLISHQIEQLQSGTAQPQLPIREFKSFRFVIPSKLEQFQIVQELESKLSEADQLDQTLASALQQSAALRQSILKKAFCGQLVKQDKNDEPASVLLERIRAEKLNGMKPGKREKSS
jgi:type I restriction enzyme S subunit